MGGKFNGLARHSGIALRELVARSFISLNLRMLKKRGTFERQFDESIKTTIYWKVSPKEFKVVLVDSEKKLVLLILDIYAKLTSYPIAWR